MTMTEVYRDKLLKMLIYLDSVCERNQLRYYAIGGTFLGAVRHHGFIPWDNDIDVAMPRADYDKITTLVNGCRSQYIIETPRSEAEDYLYNAAKMYDISTTLIENLKIECKRGVFIDIFPIDGIGNTFLEVQKNYRIIKWLNNLLALKTCIERPQREWWKNMAIRIANFIPDKLVNAKKLLIQLDNLCRKYNFDESEYVGVLLTQYGMKYIMPKALFEQRKRYIFENTTVFGVADYDQYLSLLFGDWKKLPPVEKRVEGHDYKYIDLSKSYLE